MKTLVGIHMLILVICISAKVQDSKPEKLQSMGGGGFTIGYGYMDVSGLHRFTPGVASFSSSQLLIGGEGHGMVGRLVVGGGGFGIIGNTIRTDSLEVSIGGGMGTFDLGYLLVSKDRVKIFPLVGIGSGGYNVNISKNRNVSLGTIVEDPGQEIKINKGSFVMDFSFNINFIPQLTYDEDEGTLGGFMTGIKVGCIVGPKSSTWSYSGGDVTGGPNFGMNAVYVKLVIGGFGQKKP